MTSDKLKKIFDTDNLGLLDYSKRDKPQTSSDRLESSFLEINDFFNENNRGPEIMSVDMLEHRLGVRLRGIRADDEKVELLKHLDINNLLVPEDPPESIDEVFSDDDLGLFDDPTGILTLRNIPKTKISTEDYIARRIRSMDFALFEPLFAECHKSLKAGNSSLIRFEAERQVVQGRFYILSGVMAYVVHIDPKHRNRNGDFNARMRVIFENGTESNILFRSFARALYEDGQIVVANNEQIPVLSGNIDNNDTASGYIYVLSSLSDDPKLRNIQNLYKIGFSATTVEQRIKNAKNDPTYLLAPVKIVATYKTFNMNTQKFELILHKIFSEAKLDMDLVDKSGNRYIPSEWFVVPIEVIDTAIRMIISGDIMNYVYDTNSKSIIENSN